jgi:hypothetical protein
MLFNTGINELFMSIARKLVSRKDDIEYEQWLRSRDSILLHEDGMGADATQRDVRGGWSCC